MLLRAIAKHGVDPRRSFMVGDKESDVAAGKAAGVRTIRILTPDEDDATCSQADWKVRSLREAADVILSSEEGAA
jgi:D-glycero-D-manno-heptose 1,7-bisphosphate phosphatase